MAYHPLIIRWASRAVRGARYRNKNRLPFDITREYVLSLWTGVCPVFGTLLKPGSHSKSSPALDRKIPELGYTVGNIAIISVKANLIKQDASFSEVRGVARWMEKALTKKEYHE